MWQLTKEEQTRMTPSRALELLKEGNKRFCRNLKINRNMLQQIMATADSQYPFAVILSCIDSRTSAELIFDQSLGSIFSIRIAGNIINTDIIASMEFACKIAGAKLIAVIGHTKCSAIQAACDQIQLGHIPELTKKIEPAIAREQETVAENRKANNPTYLANVAKINVALVMRIITQESLVLKELCAEGKLDIEGGLYHVETGEVDFFSDFGQA